MTHNLTGLSAREGLTAQRLGLRLEEIRNLPAVRDTSAPGEPVAGLLHSPRGASERNFLGRYAFTSPPAPCARPLSDSAIF
jgi:hypothetical protein